MAYTDGIRTWLTRRRRDLLFTLRTDRRASGARTRCRNGSFAQSSTLLPLESRLLFSTALLGVNLEEVSANSRSFVFADAMKSARHFGSVEAPWDEAAPVDANGWP